ncbi:pantothenate kinase [Colwellia psychrerythraea]|uniref:Type III pantothenate kinase n=1 Tax=Colwellia psychrerythraea TaxID=28229 RepID=A0A099L1F0_COLPS|nr:pantothenate kinase [Colwellia psychrerythraea]KGJ96651.1 putative transcriptional acitvator, Baf family [Colwellia psychrerythraea]
MIVLIDIGNSRTKYTQLVEGRLSAIAQLNNQDFTLAYFAKHFSHASQVVVANVASSSLSSELSTWCTEQNISFRQVHSEQQKNALQSAYQQPTTLGIDRWLALLGTIHLYPNENVLIIDAGTATTIDLVAGSGQHQGGWILAGIKALFNSIVSNSTLVHAKSTAVPSLAFGSNTSDNVNNACWAATLGMVEQAISQAQQLSDLDRIILTGGDGKVLTTLLLAQTSEKIIAVENIQFIDNLIFYGLQEYC